MSDDLPTDLADLIARIEAPASTDHASVPQQVPDDITGELASLARWWGQVAPTGRLTDVQVTAVGPWADTAGSLAAGLAAADRAIDAGATLLIPRCAPRDDLAARSVIALLTHKEASAVVHQRPGMSDREWMDRTAAVRDAAAAASAHRGEPLTLLSTLDAKAVAAVVGVLLGSAARRTPCLLDGTDELAAALVADRLCFRARGWWRAGSTSPDPGRDAALQRIDLAAGLPLSLSDDAGRGAQATVALLHLLD